MSVKKVFYNGTDELGIFLNNKGTLSIEITGEAPTPDEYAIIGIELNVQDAIELRDEINTLLNKIREDKTVKDILDDK